jgi:hypothetical protein
MNPALAAVSSNPNSGRLINFILGFQGVTPGGQMTVNMPVNSRVHRYSLQCSGIAYQAPVILPTLADTGNVVFTPVFSGGVITGVTFPGGATSSLADGTYALRISDVPGGGIGATGTYTVATGVVTAAVITLGGVIGPVSPDIFFTSFQNSVNGVIMRDIDPDDILGIPFAQNKITQYIPRAGELPVYFTEPWRNSNRFNDTTSWDLIGQSTWNMKGGITRNITSPGVTGWYEFDFIRNQRQQTAPQGGAIDINGVRVAAGKPYMAPFCQPVRQHSYSIPVVSGMYNINWLPFDVPISRIWLIETGPGSIFQVEIYEDGNKILEVTDEQNFETYGPYGFLIGKGAVPVAQLGAVVNGTYEPAQAVSQSFLTYDAAFVSDPDQRLFKALQCSKSLNIRVYSSAQTNIRVVMESLPGAFK